MTEENQDAPEAPAAPTKEEGAFSLLDSLVAKHGDGTPEPGESSDDPAPEKPSGERNEKGQFASKAKDDEPEDSGEPEGDAPAKEEPAAKPEGYEKALAALRRDGWDTEAIEALSVDALVKTGVKRAEAQAEVDREWARLRDQKEAAKVETADPQGQPAQGLDELAEPLKDYLDDEGTQALVQLLTQANATATGEAAERLKPLEAMVENLLYENALRGLETTWSQLSDTEQRKAVREKVDAFNLKVYVDNAGGDIAAGLNTALGDACRTLFNQADGASGQVDLDRQKNNGRTRTTHKRAKPRALSPVEKDFDLLDKLTKKHEVRTPE